MGAAGEGWHRLTRWAVMGGAVCTLLPYMVSAQTPASRSAAPNADTACAGCHRTIYEHYEATPMARASGAALDGLMEGNFTHAASGVHYRIFERDGAGWLSYARPETVPGGYLSGEVKLAYFIGSNTRGRTYLFERDGYWFETPVNWYAKKRMWDMAPNFLNAHEMPLTLPVDANCLHCHVSGVAEALPGARNHFAAAPFAHGGIGCASCHGDATEHLRTKGKAPVLNPSKLDAARRDSVCLQCHLEGETAAYRLGHSLATYRPGESLFDSVAYFVHQGEVGPEGRATSQYEALLESACKRASGDTMTCTTCHDPHASETTEAPAERTAYYRAKCLSCHTGAKYRTTHHPEQQDCATCHMPRSASEDIAHEQVTDHRIQIANAAARTPRLTAERASRSRALVPIGEEKATDRELGLAYAQVAKSRDRASGQTALTLLRKAEALEAATVKDPELHTELGFLEQESGDIHAADREYRAALAADPDDGTARGDVAVLFAETGDYATAVRLWKRVFDADPAQAAAGYNLALGECRLGQKGDAEATLERLLRFAPDNQRARALAAALAGGTRACADAQR
ncbi:MAG TPA: multiheme c-type cytochrome [Acidobacteriaceae bacterium]|jgi:tetratricopeptide (TPR) repeat protein|nr:multiheme c-type cytochrome [Acidobacteriaceae bacterium]